MNDLYRSLPSIDRVLADPRVVELAARAGREVVAPEPVAETPALQVDAPTTPEQSGGEGSDS